MGHSRGEYVVNPDVIARMGAQTDGSQIAKILAEVSGVGPGDGGDGPPRRIVEEEVVARIDGIIGESGGDKMRDTTSGKGGGR